MHGPACGVGGWYGGSGAPSGRIITPAPSRPKIGLRTHAQPNRSYAAGKRFSWPGFSSHSTGRIALFERIIFQGGSSQRVVSNDSSSFAANGSRSIHSHGYSLKHARIG